MYSVVPGGGTAGRGFGLRRLESRETSWRVAKGISGAHSLWRQKKRTTAVLSYPLVDWVDRELIIALGQVSAGDESEAMVLGRRLRPRAELMAPCLFAVRDLIDFRSEWPGRRLNVV